MAPRSDKPILIDLTGRPRAARRLVVGLALSNLAFLGGTALSGALVPADGPLGHLIRHLDLRTERSLAAWYSSVVLLASAAGFVLAFAADRLLPGPTGRRRRDWGWIVLALVFVAISFDEVAALHETAARVAQNPFEGYLDDWVGVLAVPIAVVAAGFALFAWCKLRPEPGAAALFGLGLALFASVPAQEQLQNWIRAGSGGRHVAFALLEEGAEVFGSLAFLAAGVRYASRRRAAAGHPLAIPAGAAAGLALGTLGALAAGLLLVHVLLAETGLRMLPGTVPGWFGSTALLLTVAVAALAWPRRRSPVEGLGWLLVAATGLVVAADLGSGRTLTEVFWPGSPRRILAVHSLLAAGAVGGGVALAVSAGRWRWRGLLWAAAVVAALFAGPASPWLLIAAAAAMLPATLPGRKRCAACEVVVPYVLLLLWKTLALV